jgi:hypothetical protein
VTEKMDPIDARTNGTHPEPDVALSQPLDRELRFDGVSLDQHFDALMEMVRDWDWRTVSLETGHPRGASPTPAATSAPPAPEPNSVPIPAPASPTEADVREELVAPDTESVPGGGDPQAAAVESMPRQAPHEPASSDPPPAPLEDLASPAAPSRPSPPSPPSPPSAAKAQGVAADPETAHSRIKMAALYVAGAVAVLLAIGGIRLFA